MHECIRCVCLPFIYTNEMFVGGVVVAPFLGEHQTSCKSERVTYIHTYIHLYIL